MSLVYRAVKGLVIGCALVFLIMHADDYTYAVHHFVSDHIASLRLAVLNDGQ
jgi:hypothetical protein